jgi:hypothetical protein
LVVLRSGLRGGADLDGNGALSYRELEGFVGVATRAIVNEKFRPRLFATAPGSDRSVEMWRIPLGGTRLQKPAGVARRVTVRDSRGVRIFDMNAAAETTLAVVLPGDSDLTVTDHAVGREAMTYNLERKSTLVLGEGAGALARREVMARGEARVFETLFLEPYSEEAVAKYQSSMPVEETFGMSEKEMDRFALTLKVFADQSTSEKRLSGYTGIGIGSALLAGGTAMFVAGSLIPQQQSSLLQYTGVMAAVASLAFAIPGIVQVSRPAKEAKMLKKLQLARTRDERMLATLEAEAELEQHVKHMKGARIRGSIAGIALGSILIGVGAVNLGLTRVPSNDLLDVNRASTGVFMAAGAAYAISSLLRLTIWKTTQERLWELYLTTGRLQPGEENSTGKTILKTISVAPIVAPQPTGGTLYGGSLGFQY